MREWFGISSEILMSCVVNDALVTVAKFRRAAGRSVSFHLDGRKIQVVDSNVIAEDGHYSGVQLVAHERGRDLIVILSCPNKLSPEAFLSAYPRGVPSLSITMHGPREKVITPQFRGPDIYLAWPSF